MCTCAQTLARISAARGERARQRRRVVADALQLASGHAPAQRDLVLEPVTVVNPGEGRTSHACVEVRDGRITAIGPAAATRTPPGPPRFVLPGLVDLHTHAFPGMMDLFGRLELMHGVTSVRNTGADASIFDYKRAVARGERVAPRIFAGGLPLDGRPTAFPRPFSAPPLDTPEAGRRIVRWLAERGADHVKTFINLTPPVIDAIRREAAEHALPVIGHVPRFSRIESAGVVDVQHLTGIPEGPTTAFATDGSFGPWLEAWQRLGAERRARVEESCLEHDIAHTATLVLWKGLARCADPTLERPATRGLLPDVFAEVLWNTRRPAGPYVKALRPGVIESVREAWPRMLEATASLREAGVTVLAGTDVVNPWIVPGQGLHEELETLVACGYDTEEVLRLATSEAGARLGVPGLGRLEPGAPADLLVLREDPSRDLDALATLESVVANGRSYDVATLRDEQAAFCERFSGVFPRLLARLGAAAVTALFSALPAPTPEYAPEA